MAQNNSTQDKENKSDFSVSPEGPRLMTECFTFDSASLPRKKIIRQEYVDTSTTEETKGVTIETEPIPTRPTTKKE